VTQQADVLLIANNFPPMRGGSAAVYASLARHCGPRIVVMAPKLRYVDGLPLIGWREFDRTAPFHVQRLKLLRTKLNRRPGFVGRLFLVASDVVIRVRILWWLLILLRRERPRAVCVGELLASRWLIRLLRLLPGLRVVVYVHGEEITTHEPYDQRGTRRIQGLLAADHIIVVSDFTKRAVLDLLHESESPRITLIGNGVDTSRFVPLPRNAELAACYGLGREFLFVTVCRLLEKKGVDQTLRAFAELLKQHPDTRYVIVGSGPYEDYLRGLTRALDIQDKVVFAGDVAEAELAAHYQLGDVFIMPNRALPNGDTEGFGLVFLEANACGVPVIAGRDGGSTDAVRDGENGLVVDGNSVPAVLHAMLALREDGVLRARLRQGGLAVAVESDWRRKAAAFLRVCTGGEAAGA